MAKNGKPAIFDPTALIQAGIDPRTGLPAKFGCDDEANLKPEIKKLLRIRDEQDSINRYTWYNLPQGLNGQLIERILYYRGQAAFFFLGEEFYFLPYALDGTIDVYGRYTGITPVPFAGGKTKEDKPWIQGLKFKPKYDIVLEDQYDENTFEESCVLLSDYSNQLGQTNISRQILQEPVLDLMANCYPYANTNLIASIGATAIRVPDQDCASNVEAASKSVKHSALTGSPWIPVVGNLEFQDMQTKPTAQCNDYLLFMNSLNNFRLSCLGLANGGLWERQGTTIQDEFNTNATNTDLVITDGLTLRQRFCNIVNSIWGLGIWCEATSTVQQLAQPAEEEMESGINDMDSSDRTTSADNDSSNSASE